MANIYLLHYNNYYNRIVKKIDTLSGYYPYLINNTPNPLININFNPNDGVSTELIINWSSDIPDYLIVSENGTSITSRWFVMEASRTRAKQFRLVLRRDVVVDNYDAIVNAPCYIDKAYVKNTDIAIFNKEAYKFNTIKQSETLLKDSTNCAWIVGYCSYKDVDTEGEEYSLTGDVYGYLDVPEENIYTNIADFFNASAFTGLSVKSSSAYDRKFYGHPTEINHWLRLINAKPYDANNLYTQRLYIFKGTEQGKRITVTDLGKTSSTTTPPSIKLFKNGVITGSTSAINNLYGIVADNYPMDAVNSILETREHWNDTTKLRNLQNLRGTVLKDSTTNKYYVVSVEEVTSTSTDIDINSSLASAYTTINNALNNATYADLSFDIPSNMVYQVRTDSFVDYVVKLQEVSSGIKYSLPADTSRLHLTDAPYDMFCMPYDDYKYIYNNQELTSSKALNLATAFSIASDLSGVGFVYDIQLLPYCPLPFNSFDANNRIIVKNQAKVGKIGKNLGLTGEELFGYIMFCDKSSFEKTITYTVNVDNYKQQHQTDNWRFLSPNYSGAYDFDVTLNKGLSYVDVDCTYKPITPYIHLCPRFNDGGYYGYNNNDAQGLVCGGDFSLPVINDKWQTYEYSNKNYQNIFNRQIENINTNYKLQMIESGISAIANTGVGIMSGAVMGGIPGAIAGGIASLAGGAADQYINKAKKEETVSYAADTFNYQIDNIKALPNTLTKVSSFNANNKIFPFVEYYSCTEQEKTIFNDLIKYQGMSVERVDKIVNFIDTDVHFLRGRLIRLEDISEDTHMTSQIAQEIAKGVYI